MTARLCAISIGIIVALALLATGAHAAGGGTAASVAESRLPQPIYFFTNTAQPINKQNHLVIRPQGFLLFQDGQWVLERLRWTGWGSSVARATGVSNSSNDIPDAANGKRIKTWARVTLSNPGRFRGHEVYRCFTMTVPPPASGMHLCLGRTRTGVYILEPAKQPRPTPKVSNPPAFYARPPGGFITCGIAGGVSEEQALRCQGAPVGTDPLENVATLRPDGRSKHAVATKWKFVALRETLARVPRPCPQARLTPKARSPARCSPPGSNVPSRRLAKASSLRRKP